MSTQPRLLDRVRDKLRYKQYSLRTEQAYIQWIKRFIYFHGKRHPEQMNEIIQRDLLWLDGIVRPKRPARSA